MPAEFTRLRPVLTPGCEETAVEVEHLDPMVRLIGDVQTPVFRDRHSAWIIKLARAASTFAPDVKPLARGGVD